VVILRAFLALLAGYATVAALVIGITALLSRLMPSWSSPSLSGAGGKLQPSYAFASTGCSFLASAAGGYVTAWAAAANPLIHVLALGMVVLAMAALSAMQSRGKQPIWYALAQVAILPLGVLAGGLVRLRALGIL